MGVLLLGPDQPGNTSLPTPPNRPLAAPVSRWLASAGTLAPSPVLHPSHHAVNVFPALSLLLALASAPVAAGHSQDPEQQVARRAVQQGRYVPLESVVRDALKRHAGQLLEVELDDGVYEVEILRADGVVVELDYDARTGKLLKTELDD
ncbi:hypothetical protein C1931_18740 [Stenotrophomonas sp. YAU14A_MKIMI4_1]|nr:hypothetical protein C1931_18740 [Stenotrophomonas sp. YAU14A_MKIMI4_1]